MQKLLSLIRFHLFMFAFISFALGDRKNNATIYVSVLPMFSSKSFVVSGLTYRSSISFEYIFVYGMRKCSNFFLLHVTVLFYQDCLLKRLPFP